MLERCVAFYRGPLSGESWRLFSHVILSRLRFEACLARSGYSLALELALRWIWVCGLVQRCFCRRVASDAFTRCGRMFVGSMPVSWIHGLGLRWLMNSVGCGPGEKISQKAGIRGCRSSLKSGYAHHQAQDGSTRSGARKTKPILILSRSAACR